MNKDDLLIPRILGSIPTNMNAVDYLMDILNIGRESVYRRLRGKIPFTFEEIMKLSLMLDFSVDDIIKKSDKQRGVADLSVRLIPDAEEAFRLTLEEFYEHINGLKKATENETIVTLNRLLLPLVIGYRQLFKFFYYKWTHQMRDVSINFSYSDIYLPSEMNSLYQRIYTSLKSVKDINIYIFDYNTFKTIIKEIQYYYKRKLITDEELRLLKDDLLLMFSDMEKKAKRGMDETGSINYYYLSILNIDSNNIYTCSDKKAKSYYWSSSVNPITVVDPDACEAHRKWLNSLKKYAMLMTQSNEILLAEFLNLQREYLDKIEGETFI